MDQTVCTVSQKRKQLDVW